MNTFLAVVKKGAGITRFGKGYSVKLDETVVLSNHLSYVQNK